MYLFGAIVAISLLIIVHEAGHFFVAKLCKMRVDRFSLGFGPALVGFKRRGTLFQIAPIPFGGFVEIRGMNIAEDVDPDDPYAYPNRPAWMRFATIFAGPATNYLFAIVLAFGLFSIHGAPTGDAHWLVVKVDAEAAAAGKLRVGDIIHAVDGTPALAMVDRAEPEVGLSDLVTASGGKPVTVTVLRDGALVDVSVTPTAAPFCSKLLARSDATEVPLVRNYCRRAVAAGTPMLGITRQFVPERTDVGLVAAAGHALWYPIAQTQRIVEDLRKIITREAEGEFAGPVQLTSEIKKQFEIGWENLIGILMVLNVYLGLFNLFPLPALDGGRLVFLGYEMATRRRANPKIEATVHMVGIMALMVLLVVVTFNDCKQVF